MYKYASRLYKNYLDFRVIQAKQTKTRLAFGILTHKWMQKCHIIYPNERYITEDSNASNLEQQ